MPEELDRRRILVVDDEERMVRFIRLNLEHDGFQVSEAFNGKQAVQRLRDVNPDLILLDIIMPNMPGTQVAEELLNHKATKAIPIIFVTAIVKRGEVGPRDDKIGGRYFIFKPVKLDELVSEIGIRLND